MFILNFGIQEDVFIRFSVFSYISLNYRLELVFGITDKKLYQQTIKAERLLLILKRYECNLIFLMKCRDTDIYPKFVRFKTLKNKPYEVKNHYYRSVLLHEITTKNRSIRNLTKTAF